MSNQLKVNAMSLPLIAALWKINESEDFIRKNYDALFDYFVNSGEMPYDVAKARTGDPYAWIADRLNQVYYSVESEL